MSSENKIQILEELIRTASNKLLTKNERLAYMKNPILRKALYDKHPNCFMQLKRMGQDTQPYFLCICNRIGIIDPDVIELSYKAVKKIMKDSSGVYDVNDLTMTLDKLDKLKRKYSKEVPRPPQPASKKGMVTKMFNNIKGHLEINRR